MKLDREALGRRVREVWIAWACRQPAPKPSWLVPWEELPEPDREVDRQIGEIIAYETLKRAADEREAAERPWNNVRAVFVLVMFAAALVVEVRGCF